MSLSLDLDVDEIPIESLEYVEEQLFYQFDEAYRQYKLDGLPMRPEVRAYREALEVVTAIRQAVEAEQGARIERTAGAARDVGLIE